MKKILVLGLCCGIVTAASAGTTSLTKNDSSDATHKINALAPAAAVKPMVEPVVAPQAKDGAQLATSQDPNRTDVVKEVFAAKVPTTSPTVDPSMSQEEAAELYMQLKHSGQAIPEWVTETAFPAAPFVARQGGDTPATAVAIPSLPYSDAGTTTGGTNAIGPYVNTSVLCTWNGYYSSTSTGSGLDVFYTLTLAAETTVEFSMCGSGYDSALGIFENVAGVPGTLVAGNDDSCGTQSYVLCTLPAGDYFVVVDGYGSGNGAYVLDVAVGIDPCDAYAATPATMPSVVSGDNTGLPSVIGGEGGDAGFEFTVVDGLYSFDACAPGTAYAVDLYLYDGSPCDGAALVASDTYFYCTAGGSTDAGYIEPIYLSAGTYQLLVSSTGTGEGLYEVALNVEVDPCDSYVPIAATVPSTVIGDNTGYPDIYSGDGGDAGYEFTLADGYYSFSACQPGTAYDVDLYLFLGSPCTGGTLVTSNTYYSCAEGTGTTAAVIAPLQLAAGDYTLLVTSTGTGEGAYEVVMAQETDPCDDYACVAVTLPVVDYVGNTTGATNIFGNTSGDNYFCFTADEDCDLEISLCGTPWDTYLRVFEGAGPCDGNTTTIATNDDNFTVCGSSASYILLPVTSGTNYIVLVEGYSANEGEYTLNIGCTAPCDPVVCDGTPEVEPNGDGASANTIACEDTVCGETSVVGGVRDLDYFELILANDAIVTATLDVDAFDGYLWFYDSDATTVIEFADDNLFCEDESLVTPCLPAGTYYVAVASANFTDFATANYGLTVSCEACEWIDPCDLAIALPCGTVDLFGSTLGMPNLAGNSAGDVLYTLDVPALSTVNITLCSASTNYDSYLRLYDICPTDPLAVQLFYDDDGPVCDVDSAPYEPSHIENAILDAGTYYVLVDGFSANEGDYGITVTCEEITCLPIDECTGTPEVEPNDGSGDPPVFGAVVCGETICGTTSTQGDTLRDIDIFELILTEDASVEVNADVEEFDAILQVISATCGDVVAGVDDFGFCEDETLTTDCLAAGTYYVLIAHNAFAGVDVPANYSLTVNCTPCTFVPPAFQACQDVSPIDGDWIFGVSEIDTDGLGSYLSRYDRFGGVEGSITAVDFVGLSLFNDGFGWSVCAEDPTPFQITFYEAGACGPGAFVAAFDAELTGVPTGDIYAGVYESLAFHFDLPTALPLTDGYIGIIGGGSPDCWFLWASSDTGADAESLLEDGLALTTEAFDLNYCLTFAAGCDAPNDVSISISGGNAVLNWTAVPGASSYNVYYALDGYGSYSYLATSLTNSATDSGATAAGRRNYKIVAVCD